MSDFSARYWHWHDENVIQCDLCPRFCRLREGQRGFCYVRAHQDKKMVLTTYGRSSGFCVDPIEKKPLNHFYPGSSVLSFGTAGCNLGCKFCQNWDISKSRQMDSLAATASPKAIALKARELGCKSVAFTYNDPVIFAEYAMDTAIACREVGVKNVVVSAGYINAQARKEFYEPMDAANVDLKAFTQDFYRKQTLSDLKPVLETLVYLVHETNVWVEITNLIIPGLNDDLQELTLMSQWILKHLGPDVPLHFTAFHPDYKMMHMPPTPIATLLRAQTIAKEEGLNFVYVGNVHDQKASSTYCPFCGTCLIERDWYELGAYHLQENKCKCGREIPGQFSLQKENWGRKRLPLGLRL